MRAALAAAALLVSLPAHAASTLKVGAGGYGSLAAAVSAAQAGDTVLIDPGTWVGGVTIDKDLTIAGLNAPVITGDSTDIFRVTAGTVVLSGLVLHPDGGRGVRADGGHVSLVGLTIEDNPNPRNNNVVSDGAAVRVSGATTLDVSSCVFRDNKTQYVLFYSIPGYGGHLYVNGTSRADTVVHITNTTFDAGSAETGGAIYARKATIDITDSVFTSNVAQDAAGTLYANDVALTVTGSDFSGGRTTGSRTDGATLYLDSATTTLTDTTITDGRATRNGGAIYANAGSLTLDRVILTGNHGVGGGAAYLTGAAVLRVTDTATCGNVATGAGGAFNLGGGVDALWTRVSSITDSGAGGFLSAQGAVLTLDHVDVLDAGGSGAAVVASGGTVAVRDALIAWSAARGLDAPGATVDYDAFFGNVGGDLSAGTTLGAGPVSGDPLLARYLRDGVCGNDDLRVSPTSPLIDAGDPAELDPDGSRTDIGVIGGADADPNVFDDDDRDGFIQAYDCDDLQGFIHPGALEICDGLDNDCDGVIDGPNPVSASTWYTDADGDGYGMDGTEVLACDQPDGTAPSAGDCDDRNTTVHPGVPEVCDGIDNNCVGGADGSDAQGQLTWFQDGDGDGHGARGASLTSCGPPDGFVLVPDDCDDTNAAIAPGAVEHCDGVDEDCDTIIDGPDPVGAPTWTYDGDGDGFGNRKGGKVDACAAPDDYVREEGDCDDQDPDVHPRAPESCDGTLDSNCDGLTGSTDHDGDGVIACEDCDDADENAFPGAPDTPYDGVVTDCESLSDFDADRDGYDAIAYSGDDCVDDDPTIAPGLTDVPDDGVDQDCSGEDAVSGTGPGACGCDQQGLGGVGIAWLAMAMARRRSRR